MERAKRYQMGTIEQDTTKDGVCWYIRFTVDKKRPRFRIGTKAEFPTKAKASRAAQAYRDQVNSNTARAERAHTFGDVVDRYEREEMPTRYSTRRGYMQIHRLYILPKWGKTTLSEMDAMEVRRWLIAADPTGVGWKKKKEAGDLPDSSTRTLGHIHGQMRVLFRFAMLWKWMPSIVNPMSLFSIPGATKRKRTPRVITPAQFRELLQETVDVKKRTMLVGAYLLGVGASELFALKWGDFDHLDNKVHITRAIVDGRVGPTKTPNREAPLPLNEFIGKTFLQWRQRSHYREDGDWVFASEALLGKRPTNSQHLQHNWLRGEGKRIGLGFSLGWHTFRHSYKVLLERAGADVTVQRDLMRHADTHTTMQVYGEVEMDRMRAANDKAVTLAFAD